jgi:membrane-associated phospholipid phosphatase
VLPSLFWLVTLKRTTNHTGPEEWFMTQVAPAFHAWVTSHAPLLDEALRAISALGSGWFVALGFATVGLLALSMRRRDLALLLALGTLAFPIEWALKYFTALHVISVGQLVSALFNVNNIGLDDITDFPAGHALRATVFYGLVAFCIARLSADRRQGMIAYAVALILIGAISVTRLYLLAHYPIDLLGGWMAGAALVSILVSVHILSVDERIQRRSPPPTLTRPAGLPCRCTAKTAAERGRCSSSSIAASSLSSSPSTTRSATWAWASRSRSRPSFPSCRRR